MKYWMIIGQFLLTFAVQADSLSMLSAEGFGFADAKRVPESQARLMAVRAAKIDAQRNLLETINGVRVTAGTTVKDMALESDIIGTRVKGMLQGAFEVGSEVNLESGSWVASVTMAVCLGKDNSDCKERKTLVSVTQPNLKPTEASDRFQANDLAGWDLKSSAKLGLWTKIRSDCLVIRLPKERVPLQRLTQPLRLLTRSRLEAAMALARRLISELASSR